MTVVVFCGPNFLNHRTKRLSVKFFTYSYGFRQLSCTAVIMLGRKAFFEFLSVGKLHGIFGFLENQPQFLKEADATSKSCLNGLAKYETALQEEGFAVGGLKQNEERQVAYFTLVSSWTHERSP